MRIYSSDNLMPIVMVLVPREWCNTFQERMSYRKKLASVQFALLLFSCHDAESTSKITQHQTTYEKENDG
jgi:hypothetical protein